LRQKLGDVYDWRLFELAGALRPQQLRHEKDHGGEPISSKAWSVARHPTDWRISLDHCFPSPGSVYRRSSNSVEMPVEAHLAPENKALFHNHIGAFHLNNL
jgi:hypothetical protein